MIDNVEIPKDIQCALQDPKWKVAIQEEMKDFLTMKLRRLYNYQQVKDLKQVSGFLL